MVRSPRILGVLFLVLGAPAAGAQVFSDNDLTIPTVGSANNSATENVDFGDVDSDGDWDAVFADGGDTGNDQNRIWINQGGAQNGFLGWFSDETSSRFPQIQQSGRDVEFVDFDGDGDLDLYSSNTSQSINQTNRWWTNMGGVQAGNEGFYVDQTAARWVGLGGAGSSISPSHLIDGGFIDWSCDCDFGDLDNDGDLDLVHSSYGGAFGGDVPTRIFLNSGLGEFSEFNPSGAQLLTQQIQDGDAGLWCSGLQEADTLDTSGAFCDIATTALDVDLGDLDGDFDLDIVLGAREEAPRVFRNRTVESGGSLGFRDVTADIFPIGAPTGMGHYEQELGDLDGDGDLDLLGVNWRAPFEELVYANAGNGIFNAPSVLPGSGSDDIEGDLLDFDLDGDLDVFIANFSGTDRLYRNDGNLNFVNVTQSNIPPYAAFSPRSLDADACDVDGDGDYDVLVAADDFDRNVLLTNNTNPSSGTDQHAPVVPNLEQAEARVPGPEPTVVRAHVFDNAPYYITWYVDCELRYSVNGGPTTSVPMRSSGGQVFRGELPGTLTGNICYSVAATDEYGQTGVSITRCFLATDPTSFTDSCSGDGGDQQGCTPCPCQNEMPPGTIGGCLNSSGQSGRLLASGSPSLGAADLRIEGTGLTPGSFMVLVSGAALAPLNPQNPCLGTGSGAPSAVLDGLRCAVSGTRRHGGRAVGADGTVGMGLTPGYGPPNGPAGGIGPSAGFSAGEVRHFQGFFREPPGSGCLTEQNTTQAVTVVWSP